MNAHVSSILLGVRDLDRSKRFYTEALGWKVERDYGISVFFVPHGGSLVGFYGRDGLAANVARARTAAASAGWSSPTWSTARRGSTRSWRKPSRPAPRSSSPPPPSSGAGTAVPSRTRTATSGTSPTALRERTSLTRSSRRGELHGGCGRPGGDLVLHSVSDLATAKAVDAALLGVPPAADPRVLRRRLRGRRSACRHHQPL
jgi:catechol 2,3-dioxygenase-like lactoylglutathione lyase family enzyme